MPSTVEWNHYFQTHIWREMEEIEEMDRKREEELKLAARIAGRQNNCNCREEYVVRAESKEFCNKCGKEWIV